MYRQIISIHGVPRSGTSWLGQLIDSNPDVRYKFQPLFSNTFKNQINHQSPLQNIKDFFSDIYNTQDDFIDRTIQKNSGVHYDFRTKATTPSILATKHVRFHYLIPRFLELDNFKIIGIVRNPCGVLNSWRKAPKEFREVDGNFVEEWYYATKRNMFKPDEFFGFNKWKELTKYFLEMEKLFPQRVRIIRYEDLTENTIKEVKNLYDFIGIPVHKQTLEFINQSKSIINNDTYSIFKGNKDVNEWKNELNKVIIDKIYSELKNTEFEPFI
ncbi:MAG: sulfotransferase domain-containing protein [Bacteroidales bacterium]|jgi:hypothetical protein|nr:sulfotransferase domain-containing protein [Bacteroidales bacterium]